MKIPHARASFVVAAAVSPIGALMRPDVQGTLEWRPPSTYVREPRPCRTNGRSIDGLVVAPS
jgi:hypothetical protein